MGRLENTLAVASVAMIVAPGCVGQYDVGHEEVLRDVTVTAGMEGCQKQSNDLEVVRVISTKEWLDLYNSGTLQLSENPQIVVDYNPIKAFRIEIKNPNTVNESIHLQEIPYENNKDNTGDVRCLSIPRQDQYATSDVQFFQDENYQPLRVSYEEAMQICIDYNQSLLTLPEILRLVNTGALNDLFSDTKDGLGNQITIWAAPRHELNLPMRVEIYSENGYLQIKTINNFLGTQELQEALMFCKNTQENVSLMRELVFEQGTLLIPNVNPHSVRPSKSLSLDFEEF